MGSPFFFVDKKDGKLRPCQDYRYPNEHMPTLYHWSVNSWTNSKEHDDSLNWMFNGDTIMSGSEMGTNGKWPSKWTEDFLNQQWCSLECVTHQRYSKQWWMTSLEIWSMTALWSYTWTIFSSLHQTKRQHQEGSNMLTRQWSIPETDQMQIQPDKGWMLRTGNRRRKNLYGPRKAKRNQGLANPYNSQATQGFLGFGNFYWWFIWHFLELAKPLNDLLKKD